MQSLRRVRGRHLNQYGEKAVMVPGAAQEQSQGKGASSLAGIAVNWQRYLSPARVLPVPWDTLVLLLLMPWNRKLSKETKMLWWEGAMPREEE